MEKQKVGSFTLRTFAGKLFKFIVYDNKMMYCKEISKYPIYRLILKPKFELFGINEYNNPTSIFIPRKNISDFIESIDIDEELLEYIKINNMIEYSTDMAFLYNLSDKNGYDRIYQTRAFKHVEKSKILSKQRRGFYN